MSRSIQHIEYSARYGLKQAVDNADVAQQIAEAKYRALVGRDILSSEMNDIHKLIIELRGWIDVVKNTKVCH